MVDIKEETPPDTPAMTPTTPTTISSSPMTTQIAKVWEAVYREPDFEPGQVFGYLRYEGFEPTAFKLRDHKHQGEQTIELLGCWTAVILDDYTIGIFVTDPGVRDMLVVALEKLGVHRANDLDCFTIIEMWTAFQQPPQFFDAKEMEMAKKLLKDLLSYELKRISFIRQTFSDEQWKKYAYFVKLYAKRYDNMVVMHAPNPRQPNLKLPVPAKIRCLSYDHFGQTNVNLQYQAYGEVCELTISVDHNVGLPSYDVFFKSDIKFPEEMVRV